MTFFIGENGSGKSTLLEAIAVVAGLNAEGGTRNLRFSNRPTESALDEHVRLSWRTRQRWPSSFELRPSSIRRPRTNKLGPAASASIHMASSSSTRRSRSSSPEVFLIASHSPILLAFPAARIYEFTAEGLTQVGYQDTALYQLTRSFLEAPERFLRHLFSDDESSADQGPAESSVS